MQTRFLNFKKKTTGSQCLLKEKFKYISKVKLTIPVLNHEDKLLGAFHEGICFRLSNKYFGPKLKFYVLCKSQYGVFLPLYFYYIRKSKVKMIGQEWVPHRGRGRRAQCLRAWSLVLPLTSCV